MTTKAHYAQKAAKKFVRGTGCATPQEAIDAGKRTDEQFEAFMKREAARFWSENGQKARRKVKARHPVKRGKRLKMGQNGLISGKSCPIAPQKHEKEVLVLENRAKEWSKISGFDSEGRFSQRLCLDNQTAAAYQLYLDFVRFGVPGSFDRWLSRLSGVARRTCLNRLQADTALACGKELRFDRNGKLFRRPIPTETEDL